MTNPIQIPYLRHVWNMIHRYKYGWIQVITGMPGSGKSWTALTIAEKMDPKFDINAVGFTPKQYLDVLEDTKIGNFVVWDECGIALPARKWYSLSNILVTEVLQTMRHKRLGLILVVPDLSFIDVQARKLVHSYTEAKRRGQDPVKLWVYEIRVNRRTGDVYFPHPIIQNNGSAAKLRNFIFKSLPSKKLQDEYEEEHVKYKKKIERKARSMAEKIETEISGRELTVYDMINKVEKDIDKYKNKKGNIDWHLIKLDLRISRDKAIEIQKFIDKKTLTQ